MCLTWHLIKKISFEYKPIVEHEQPQAASKSPSTRYMRKSESVPFASFSSYTYTRWSGSNVDLWIDQGGGYRALTSLSLSRVRHLSSSSSSSTSSITPARDIWNGDRKSWGLPKTLLTTMYNILLLLPTAEGRQPMTRETRRRRLHSWG